MSFAPEIVFVQAMFKAIFALFVALAWVSGRKALAGTLLAAAALPALLMLSVQMPQGSMAGMALLWMGEFPLFALGLCLTLSLGFTAGLYALIPGLLAGISLWLWSSLGNPLVEVQLQFLREMAQKTGEAVTLPSRPELWESLAIQPGISVASGFLAAAFVLLWLGRKDGTGRIRLAHPIAPLARLEFPEWPVWAVAASLALLLAGKSTQVWSVCLALASGSIYLVRGMSVWSTISSDRLRGNILWFLALTGTALFFPQLFLVSTVSIGLFDQWFLLRERLNPSIGENP